MKLLLTFALLLCSAKAAIAQYWDSIGRFSAPPGEYYFDSLDERLYVAGGYLWYDSSEIHGFGYFESDTLYGLGCGFERVNPPPCQYGKSWTHSYSSVRELIRYKGVLYATGRFIWAGGQVVNSIAKWGATDWEPIGQGLMDKAGPIGPGAEGDGYGFEIYQDTLYLFGEFDSINDVEAHGLAKFDGNKWYPVFGLPRFDSVSDPNLIMAAKWYHGDLYIGGGFYYQPDTSPPMIDLAKWNDTAWVAVQTGITGGVGSYFSTLEIFQDELIVAGGFNPFGNPGCEIGSNIAAWNGSSWDTLRGGVDGPGHGALVMDVFAEDSAMYVVGAFETAGGLPCRNIAKWDGSIWCVLDSVGIDKIGITEVARVGNSLYISGDFNHINNNPAYRYAARFVGDINYNCQQSLSAEEGRTGPNVQVFPNPVSSLLHIRSEGSIISNAIVYDMQGRKIAAATGSNSEWEVKSEIFRRGFMLWKWKRERRFSGRRW